MPSLHDSSESYAEDMTDKERSNTSVNPPETNSDCRTEDEALEHLARFFVILLEVDMRTSPERYGLKSDDTYDTTDDV